VFEYSVVAVGVMLLGERIWAWKALHVNNATH